MKITAAIIITALTFSTSYAREVDQFMTWGTELDDSLYSLNNHMNSSMQMALNKMNERSLKWKQSRSCQQIAYENTGVFFQLFYQKIEKWGDTAEGIDRAPTQTAMTNKEYLRSSYFKSMPLNVPLSRVIKVNKINIGSDKLGHFTSFGRRYLNVYKKQIKAGKTHEQALESAIKWGHGTENSIVGKWMTKVLSYGDLEANFQGLLFQLDLCDQENEVHFEFDGNNWKLVGEVNMAKYINPNWDETWNISVYAPKFWEKTASPTIKKYCKFRTTSEYLEMKNYYDTFTPSFNMNYLKKIESEIDKDVMKQEYFSLDKLCGKS